MEGHYPTIGGIDEMPKNDLANCPRSHLRRRRFDAEIIELFTRRYITYRLGYRDLVAMMAEQGPRQGREMRVRRNHPGTPGLMLTSATGSREPR